MVSGHLMSGCVPRHHHLQQGGGDSGPGLWAHLPDPAGDAVWRHQHPDAVRAAGPVAMRAQPSWLAVFNMYHTCIGGRVAPAPIFTAAASARHGRAGPAPFVTCCVLARQMRCVTGPGLALPVLGLLAPLCVHARP